MPKISVLDENTINKIAAGEVIERPSAVVKELVENSIDAGANAVTVEIKEGGLKFIRITDNGSGIDSDDMPLVFVRHSTSKIRTAEDLLKVSSLGFRGEALSSIAAVAQVELVTKTNDAFAGIRYLIAGGEEKGMEQIGCPNGTTFIVRNLFYNTPARRKFLKSPVTEAGYISELMERLALSHPEVSFKFINNGQIKLHTSGNSNLKDVIYNVYGRDIASNLLLTEGAKDDITLTGYIGKPVISRGNRNYENYFVNGRYVKNPMVNKAIEEAFRPYIMLHRYPFTCLHIRINSELIDVNVHPAKKEIRFKNGDEVYQLIYHTLKNALESKEMIPDVSLTEEKETKIIEQNIPEPFEEKRREKYYQEQKYQRQNGTSYNTGSVNSKNLYSTNVENTDDKKNYYQNRELMKETEIGKLHDVVTEAPVYIRKAIEASKNPDIKENEDDEMNSQESMDRYRDTVKEPSDVFSAGIEKPEQLSFISKEAVKSHRIIGQAFATYWIVEFEDKLFFIDQHAAHEKVLYERIMKSFKEKQFHSQYIEPPIILSLTMREEEALKKHMEQLREIGFEIEEFGGKEYAVRAIPTDLFGLAQSEILLEFIDGLVDEVYNETPEMLLDKIATMSCKAAVKGNQKLSYEEAKALIEELLELDNPYNCPHGRPTIISMSKYELEKKFKRIV
ncbi:MAG: DNA mismatch repair protein MutL [Lachnoclostridium sp.]|jgi:DNA mismatch repair protein MutL